jgi:hypothetical protein
MTMHHSSSPTNPTAWQALREYLVDAYSNSEMRQLIELTIVAEAGTQLPDERVSSQEYAATLCGLIQRHSRVPGPEFWQQLVADRPRRQQEIAKLRAFFHGLADEPRLPAAPPLAPRAAPWRHHALRAVVACLLSALGATAYCTVTSPPKTKVICRDGTQSPTCDEPRAGCCSGHGGLAPGYRQ